MDDKALMGVVTNAGLLTPETGASLLKEASSLGRSVEDILYSRRLIDDVATWIRKH